MRESFSSRCKDENKRVITPTPPKYLYNVSERDDNKRNK